jgi:hypothetical protein
MGRFSGMDRVVNMKCSCAVQCMCSEALSIMPLSVKLYPKHEECIATLSALRLFACASYWLHHRSTASTV